jgi:DNA mismatch repair protein MutL
MTVQQASSQQLLFPLICQTVHYRRVELAAGNGLFLKTLVKIMLLFGTPVNVTESEVSLVLEQLLSDLHDGILTVVLVKMIRLQNPKFSCKNRTV